MAENGSRQVTIDYLRGIAAMMVCFCHFRYTLPKAFDHILEVYGALGVQIFFVISGYIIPYSMARSRYEISSIHRFLAKRLIRLHPPLVVAVLFTFAISLLAAQAKKETAPFAIGDLVPCLFYLKIPAENPVIWSLIVELKYYLLIALTFPALFSPRPIIRRVSFLSLAIFAASSPAFVLPMKFMPYFLIGFALCYRILGLESRVGFLALNMIAVAAAWPSSSVEQIFAGLLASSFILLFPHVNWKLGVFYGAISYSLYLIHFPLGTKFLNLILPHLPKSMGFLLLPVILLICTGVAYAMFKFVETPASDLSHRIRIKK